MEQQQQRPVEIHNAIIVNTTLGFDGGTINSGIQLKAKGLGVTFGGYVLHVPPQTAEQEEWQTAFGMEYISRVLSTVGVQAWEQLEGKALRMAIQGNAILGIGNLIEDVWFYPQELGEHYQQRAKTQSEAFKLMQAFDAGSSNLDSAEDMPKAEILEPKPEQGDQPDAPDAPSPASEPNQKKPRS